MTILSPHKNTSLISQLDKALQYHNAGQFEPAEEVYRTILNYDPHHPDALHLLGVLNHQRNRHERAVQLINRAIARNPSNPFYHCNLGVVYRALGALDRSAACYQKALEIKPDYADAYNNLANIFRKQGRLKEAVDLYQKALELQPNDAVAYNNLGHVYRELGCGNDEIICYQKALRVDPANAQTYLNLANGYQCRGELDRAIAFYKNALKINPEYSEAYNNMGRAWVIQGKLTEARRCFQKALLIKPLYAEAYNNLGSINQNQGKFQEGIFCFKKALEINTEYCETHSNLLYAMQYDPDSQPEHQFEEATNWWQHHGSKIQRSSPPVPCLAHGKPIKIGYVSPDFREHSVSYFFLPLISNLDHESFEVYCYSAAKHEDHLTNRIKALCDYWRPIAWQSDAAVAEQVRKDGIDILVDLAGHTAENRLLVFARKPAPVQITWLGYPNTTGMPVMDYRLTDDIADPPGQADQLHSETLIRLPDGFLCYSPPDDAPDVSWLPARQTGRITFGSFNNLPKINEAVIALWSRLLRQVPQSDLLLKSKQFADEPTRQRFLDLFASNGIAAERISLLPRVPSTAGHLALYHQVDIGLDPFPYNGTTTTCEALWMGVPVVSLRGDRHAGRVGASILTRVGLEELTADSEEQYLEIGRKLAGNLDLLEEYRAVIRPRMGASALCDGNSFAQTMEITLRRVLNFDQNGVKPNFSHLR